MVRAHQPMKGMWSNQTRTNVITYKRLPQKFVIIYQSVGFGVDTVFVWSDIEAK